MKKIILCTKDGYCSYKRSGKCNLNQTRDYCDSAKEYAPKK